MTFARSAASPPGGWPERPAERDRFILEGRPPRPAHDPWRHHGLVFEDERTAEGTVERVATVFLTGRECPWRCAMCDLWKDTTVEPTPPGAIAAQVVEARRAQERAGERITQIKLYNAGSFFDPKAVPEGDYGPIAAALADLSRVIVESHPALVGRRASRFAEAASRARSGGGGAPALEIAMGLETAHPEALERLNKRMSLDDFLAGAEKVRALGAALRAFVLVQPPFVPEAEQEEWLTRSVDFAFGAGATAVSLIPMRDGNGTVEALVQVGLSRLPRLADLERALALALERAPPTGSRVFADLWDLERLADCSACTPARRARLHAMNLEQRLLPPIPCARCA